MAQQEQEARVFDDIRTLFDTAQADPAAPRAVLLATVRLLAEGRAVSVAEIAGSERRLP